jgi:hypothetical protein
MPAWERSTRWRRKYERGFGWERWPGQDAKRMDREGVGELAVLCYTRRGRRIG